jgi:hypothetical protein
MTRALVKTFLTAAAVFLILAAETSAHPAWGVAVDTQGQVYFSDLETIWKIDARGRLSVFRAGVSGRHTHELNVDEAGNLYGEDLSYVPATERYIAALWKMTPAGAFSYVLAPTDDAPKGVSIWRARDGSTYSSLRRDTAPGVLLLIKRSPDGNTVTLLGDKDAAARARQIVPYGVGGMAFGADGTLYFADGASVLKATPGGAVSPLARDIPAEGGAGGGDPAAASGTRILGLAVDARGDVLAADHDGRRVIRITPRGEVSTLARTEQPWIPTGVAARGSDIFILEAKGPTLTARVRKLSPDGRLTLLATAGENVSPAAGPRPDTPDEGAPAPSARRTPYAFIALGAGVVAFALLVWLASRARAARRLGANHD